MNYIFLAIAVLVLLFSLKKMIIIENRINKSVIQEIKQNINLLLYGIPTIIAMVYIPYQMWVLTGKSNDWDGVYVIVGSALITIIISYVYYYKKKRLNLQ
jgi:hypothetical protein